jgi:hypothetical protein
VKNISIPLTSNELVAAGTIGVLRRVSSLQNKRADRNLGPSDWSADIDGAAAEMALAKYLNVFCVPLINSFKAADVDGYQVRSTTRANGRMIIRPDDKDEDDFILVITKAPIFILVGTINCKAGKMDEFWEQDAWWVPQDRLGDLPQQSGQATTEGEALQPPPF